MKKTLTLISALLTLSPAIISAEENKETKENTPKVVSPWKKSDGEWITISGKVTDAGANTFRPDYGKGAINVEMDDYDPNLEAFNIVKDDKVVVVGRVDADADERRTIEAASVYVKNVKKTFFASPDDEEEAIVDLRKATLNGTRLILNGKITLIAPNLITIDTGYQLIDVSTQGIGTSSTAEPIPAAIKKLKVGDFVTVSGAITDGFTDSNKLIANRVTKR